MIEEMKAGKLAVILLLLALATGELFFRINKLAPENGDRFLQPYITTGDETITQVAERPEDYGYEHRGVGYYFSFNLPVKTVADREFMTLTPRAKDLKIPANPKKIFVVGGSVARGDWASEKQEWWRRLEKKLRQSRRDDSISVIPAAMASWVSSQERLAMELFVFPKKPKAIIVVDGANDISCAEREFSRPGDPFNQGFLYARYYSPWFELIRSLSNHSAIIRYFLLKHIQDEHDHLHSEVMNDPKRTEIESSSIASVYLDNIHWMARRCEQESIQCYFFLQPERSVTRKYANPAAKEDPIEIGLYKLYTNQIRSTLGVLGKKSHFYDLTHLFDGEAQQHYVDNVHFLDPGHEMMADAVWKVLADPHSTERLAP